MQAGQLGSHGDACGFNPGAGEKTLDSGYILIVEAIGLADALDMGQAGVKDDAKVFGLSTERKKLSSWS